MNIINDRNYPEEVIIAMQKDFYDGAGSNTFASPSSLNEPAKMFWCKKEITDGNRPVQASSLFAILEGNMRHSFFEQALTGHPDYKVEERLFSTINVDGRDFKISGKFDLTKLSTKNIRDWKSMKVAKYQVKDFSHFEFQQNVYKWLWEKNGMKIKKLTLLILLKDWDQIKAIKDRSLPKGEAFEHELPVWSTEKIESELKDRIRNLIKWEHVKPIEIPECSMEERWQKPESHPVFSLTKEGKVRAEERAMSGTTKYATKEEALADIAKRKNPYMYYTKCRKSTPVRCLNWCTVAKSGLCNFYTNWINNNRINYEEEE